MKRIQFFISKVTNNNTSPTHSTESVEETKKDSVYVAILEKQIEYFKEQLLYAEQRIENADKIFDLEQKNIDELPKKIAELEKTLKDIDSTSSQPNLLHESDQFVDVKTEKKRGYQREIESKKMQLEIKLRKNQILSQGISLYAKEFINISVKIFSVQEMIREIKCAAFKNINDVVLQNVIKNDLLLVFQWFFLKEKKIDIDTLLEQIKPNSIGSTLEVKAWVENSLPLFKQIKQKNLALEYWRTVDIKLINIRMLFDKKTFLSYIIETCFQNQEHKDAVRNLIRLLIDNGLHIDPDDLKNHDFCSSKWRLWGVDNGNSLFEYYLLKNSEKLLLMSLEASIIIEIGASTISKIIEKNLSNAMFFLLKHFHLVPLDQFDDFLSVCKTQFIGNESILLIEKAQNFKDNLQKQSSIFN